MGDVKKIWIAFAALVLVGCERAAKDPVEGQGFRERID